MSEEEEKEESELNSLFKIMEESITKGDKDKELKKEMKETQKSLKDL